MPVDSTKLDQTDIGILNLLQKDANLTLKELAHQLKRNKSVIGERIKKMTHQGYITSAVVLIDVKKIKSLFTALLFVQLRDHYEDTFLAIEQLAQQRPEVMECHQVMGQYDFLLKVVVRDASAYKEFLRGNISPLAYVSKVESFPMLSEIKRETAYLL